MRKKSIWLARIFLISSAFIQGALAMALPTVTCSALDNTVRLAIRGQSRTEADFALVDEQGVWTNRVLTSVLYKQCQECIVPAESFGAVDLESGAMFLLGISEIQGGDGSSLNWSGTLNLVTEGRFFQRKVDCQRRQGDLNSNRRSINVRGAR